MANKRFGKMTVVQKTKEATVLQTERGKKVVLLTPSGKCKRYERELKSGKNSRTGEVLSEGAKGYRMGYRAALGEQAKILKRKKNRP